MSDTRIAAIDVIPVKLPLREPFVISYATYPDVLSVLVRITTNDGLVGWGESTPDPNVTGETWGGTTALLALDARVEGVPAAKAALDMALHDLLGRALGVPVWALLGGRSTPHLTI